MCLVTFCFWGLIKCILGNVGSLRSGGTRLKDHNLAPGMCWTSVIIIIIIIKLLTHISVSGFNPAWNENFQFDVYVPELAVVRFVVEDYDTTSDNEFVGQYTLPFNSLKMGKFSSRRRIIPEFLRSPPPRCNTMTLLCFHTL